MADNFVITEKNDDNVSKASESSSIETSSKKLLSTQSTEQHEVKNTELELSKEKTKQLKLELGIKKIEEKIAETNFNKEKEITRREEIKLKRHELDLKRSGENYKHLAKKIGLDVGDDRPLPAKVTEESDKLRVIWFNGPIEDPKEIPLHSD